MSYYHVRLPVDCSCLSRSEVKLLNEENPAKDWINQIGKSRPCKNALTIFRSLFLMPCEISAILAKLINYLIPVAMKWIVSGLQNTFNRLKKINKNNQQSEVKKEGNCCYTGERQKTETEKRAQKTLFATFGPHKLHYALWFHSIQKLDVCGVSVCLWPSIETGCKRNVTRHVGLKQMHICCIPRV